MNDTLSTYGGVEIIADQPTEKRSFLISSDPVAVKEFLRIFQPLQYWINK